MTGADLGVTGLNVRYGAAMALQDIDLSAPRGKVTAVVGPNGAGKSSLLLGIYGSVAAQGTVTLGDTDLSNLRVHRRARAGLALVPQGRQLFPRLTVVENLRVMAELLKLSPRSVDSALDRFPILRTRARQLAGVLSGGEQQMLVVSRALMGSPDVLLLDETMTGLAPKIVQELAGTVSGLASDGVAVLIADPAPTSVLHIIDRGYVLVRGLMVDECDSAAALDRAYRNAMGVIQDEVQAEAAAG